MILNNLVYGPNADDDVVVQPNAEVSLPSSGDDPFMYITHTILVNGQEVEVCTMVKVTQDLLDRMYEMHDSLIDDVKE